jgi:hypothetical protein
MNEEPREKSVVIHEVQIVPRAICVLHARKRHRTSTRGVLKVLGVTEEGYRVFRVCIGAYVNVRV